MKIGIIGSSIYENKRKIKETIFNLSRKFNEDLIIFSGGDSNGAEKYVKKYALDTLKSIQPILKKIYIHI